MNHSYCRVRGAFLRHWLALVAAGLIFGATSSTDRVVMGQVDDEKPSAADTVQKSTYSGLQVGERVKPFQVLHIKGDEAEELEIVKDTAEGTTLICFVHRLTNDDRILFGLGMVDFYALRHSGLTSHIVLLSDDREKMTRMLRAWTRGSLFTQSLVSISTDGVEGPGYYGLNRHVAMTVLVVQRDKVVDNLVFNAPNNRDLETIMAAVAKALGKPEPTLADVQQEFRAERQRQQDMRIKASPVFKLAPNEQLGRVMFGMVNARGNRSQNAKRRSQQLLDWVGDSKERQSALQEYCKAVLAGDFTLDQYSRAAIQQLVGD